MKYLGIILDHKFRFQEHIKYGAEKCAKLIHSLSKAAKMTWGIKHAAVANIYKGAILHLLTYGAPVGIEAMNHEHNRNTSEYSASSTHALQRSFSPRQARRCAC
jgi:hypothetical protein